MTEEHKATLKAASQARTEQLRDAKANALKIGKWSIWPNADDYWVLAKTNDAGNESEYRYFPHLDDALRNVLNASMADAVGTGEARNWLEVRDALRTAQNAIREAVIGACLTRYDMVEKRSGAKP